MRDGFSCLAIEDTVTAIATYPRAMAPGVGIGLPF
jgi:hypothetical protein